MNGPVSSEICSFQTFNSTFRRQPGRPGTGRDGVGGLCQQELGRNKQREEEGGGSIPGCSPRSSSSGIQGEQPPEDPPNSHPPLFPHGAAAAPLSPHIPRGPGLVASPSASGMAQMVPLVTPQFAPPAKEEPGLGAPGSREGRILPQGTFTLAVHPCGAAPPGPALSPFCTAGGSQC